MFSSAGSRETTFDLRAWPFGTAFTKAVLDLADGVRRVDFGECPPPWSNYVTSNPTMSRIFS